jgi:hypothetical protein
MIVLILFCRFAKASGPELDLEFLTKRKDNVEVPEGIDTLMCFCSDNCKLVRCTVLVYAYGMMFFICANYAHDLIKPFALLGMMPWPTPIFGCNMVILVANGINCI